MTASQAARSVATAVAPSPCATARWHAATRLSSSSVKARRRAPPPCRYNACRRSSEPKRAKCLPCRSSRSASPVCAARRQLLGRVLVDRQVHPEVRLLERVARLIDRHPGAQQALVDEHLDGIDDRRRVGPRREVEHGLGRIEREAALEHRALGERRLLPRQQQVPRPVDRASERRLAIGGAARTGEQGEAVGQPLDELRRRQHADARRRQLDRERQAVEQGDDARDDRRGSPA